MRRRPSPPTLPPDLADRFGEPEHVFGPNLWFRAVSTVLGCFLALLGLALFIFGLAVVTAKLMPGGQVYLLLGGGLMTVGVAAVAFPRSVPRNWLFVCPGGLVRTRGTEWEGVGWAKMVRFEDASSTSGVVAVRQCRVVISDGDEWGFIADWIANYARLTTVLRQKVNGRSPGSPES